MKNQDIKTLIFECISFIDKNNKSKTISTFTFNAEFLEKSNLWVCNTDIIDPLSCILLHKQPQPYKNMADEIEISTIANMLGKSPPWVNSFIYGFAKLPNNSSSISGYMFGYNIKNELTK